MLVTVTKEDCTRDTLSDRMTPLAAAINRLLVPGLVARETGPRQQSREIEICRLIEGEAEPLHSAGPTRLPARIVSIDKSVTAEVTRLDLDEAGNVVTVVSTIAMFSVETPIEDFCDSDKFSARLAKYM